MNKKLIEAYRHAGEGYNPYLIGPLWQVAQLNFQADLAPDAIQKMDVHHRTDETFLLMAGQAVLIAADIQKDTISYELIHMRPRVLYNIPRGCWHNIALSTDAEILITEDANTHLGDFEYHYLSQEEQKELHKQIKSLWTT